MPEGKPTVGVEPTRWRFALWTGFEPARHVGTNLSKVADDPVHPELQPTEGGIEPPPPQRQCGIRTTGLLSRLLGGESGGKPLKIRMW